MDFQIGCVVVLPFCRLLRLALCSPLNCVKYVSHQIMNILKLLLFPFSPAAFQ